jgi:hypothetical protein
LEEGVFLNKTYNRYQVDYEGNYYNMMVGKMVEETDMSVILEFRFDAELGGNQRVGFFKNQVIYIGKGVL